MASSPQRHHYLRRKVPEALRPLFNCGELYKVTLRTSDRREAEKRLTIENGEFEKEGRRLSCPLYGWPAPKLNRYCLGTAGRREGAKVRDVSVLGIDPGKNSCSVVGLDATGKVVVRRRMA